MNKDEWHAVLATEPATSNQRGAIMREFGRLGFGEGDRTERLAACAALLGLDELDTTGDLTMGQAGQLVGTLMRFADRGELTAAAYPPGGGSADGSGQPAGRVAHWELIRAIAVALAGIPVLTRADPRKGDQGDGTGPGTGQDRGTP